MTGSTRELNGGMVYTVNEDVTINAGTAANALTVKSSGSGDGKIVVIDIQGGHTLTVKGGDANGSSGAGAGIMLPSDMTLYITGKGKLIATGGNAANGGNGSDGYGAYQWQSEKKKFDNGRGGGGGAGGGGAGAGIGGNGGSGSTGGSGGGMETRTVDTRGYATNGQSGGSATGGSDGTASGTVFILGDVAVTASGGKSGAAGNESWSYGTHILDTFSNDHWFAGGGGPGGAGGGGGGASSIGGGGGGGGAGGGGGSGSFLKVDDWDDWGNLNLLDSNGNMDTGAIRGEKGGNGGGATTASAVVSGGGGTTSKGLPGREHANYESDQQKSKAGDGGNGCDGHAQGGDGHLYVMPSVGISTSPVRTSDNIDSIPENNFLDVTVTLNLGLKNGSGADVTTTFRQPFANKMKEIGDVEVDGVNPRIARPGYRFAGFWTDDGLCLYGPDYKPTMLLSPFTQDISLTARWEIDSSILSVTSSGDNPNASTLDVYGNEAITLRDAVNALIANPLLVGTDGRRRVTFEELDETNTVIRLASQIEVPAGVRSFEINGLYGLEKGVEIVAAANARHFSFNGAPSDEDGAFSLASLTFTGGNVSGDAGSIFVKNGASVYVDACSFLGNRSTRYGGAIYVAESAILVSSTTFAGNSAQNGGAIRVAGTAGGRALVVNTTFSGNSASNHGGAINATIPYELDLLADTFVNNTAAAGKGPSISCANVRAVNCIFANKRGGDDQVPSQVNGTLKADWCSVGVDYTKVFASSGMAITQVVAGVTHVVHSPLGGARTGNEDAAEIYHDPGYENILAVGRDGREVLLCGEKDKAKIPFILDQLQTVRTAPTRGAVRLAVGTEPITVELDGVLYDTAGHPKANQPVEATVTVSYSDGEADPTNLVIQTADYGIFGLSVPVDGSDGLAHNVTGVKVDALGPDPIAVTMAPYALTAASVELLGSNDYLPLYGDAIAIGNVAAGSISVTNSFDARSADSFTAGSLKGFGEIDLENVEVSGGTLDWLGGNRPAAKSDAFANLGEMSIGGGAPAYLESGSQVEGTLTVSMSNTLWRTWKAENDGFFQLQARSQKPTEGEIRLKLLDGDGGDLVEVTSLGRAGNSENMRRLLWTVPVRAGDKVELAVRPADDYASFELTSVKAQFIYFGVAE